MKTSHALWIVLGMSLLLACAGGGAPQATQPPQAEGLAEEMPLPASEQTLQAAPTETSAPALQTAALPITYTLPALPASEAAIPTEFAASEPAESAPLVTQQTYLGLIIAGEQVSAGEQISPTVQSAPLAASEAPLGGEAPQGGQAPPEPEALQEPEGPQANEGIIQPERRSASAPGLISLFIPGFTCLLGILLLMLGIVMTTTASRPGQQITAVIRIADLQPGMGLVELQGNITDIPHPLDNHPSDPLAVLRLVIEQNDPSDGWKVVLDRVKAVEFSLKDGSPATVWISPEQLDLSLLGEGSFASINQAEEALKILGLKSSSAWGKGLRYRIWELRGGQTVIAVGDIQQQLRLTGTPAYPLSLAPLGGAAVAASGAQPAQKKSRLPIILVFGLGVAAVLAASTWLLILLLR